MRIKASFINVDQFVGQTGNKHVSLGPTSKNPTWRKKGGYLFHKRQESREQTKKVSFKCQTKRLFQSDLHIFSKGYRITISHTRILQGYIKISILFVVWFKLYIKNSDFFICIKKKKCFKTPLDLSLLTEKKNWAKFNYLGGPGRPC